MGMKSEWHPLSGYWVSQELDEVVDTDMEQ